jgi:hypothetical protein
MTDEMHEFPGFVLVERATAPSGHGREPDAVFDDLKELAVGQLLRSGQAHVRRRRVCALP